VKSAQGREESNHSSYQRNIIKNSCISGKGCEPLLSEKRKVTCLHVIFIALYSVIHFKTKFSARAAKDISKINTVKMCDSFNILI
jgi:hypothetical protein